MKVRTVLVYMRDKEQAASLKGSVYTSIKDLKNYLGYQGYRYVDILELPDFCEKWNDIYEDSMGIKIALGASMLSYVNIVE